AFMDFMARITNVVSLATHNHVWLRIQKIGDAVPKQRVLFQNHDPRFSGMLFWGGHVCACAQVFAIHAVGMSSREFLRFIYRREHGARRVQSETRMATEDLIRKPGNNEVEPSFLRSCFPNSIFPARLL